MSYVTVANILAVLVTLIAIASVVLVKWFYKRWERRNIPYLQPSFPGGNVRLVKNRTSLGIQFRYWYDEFKARGCKYGGTFILFSPVLNIVDLQLVKQVLQKDFQHFTDRGFYHNEEVDPISGHLLSLEGQKWKILRAKLTPTFTTGKLKMMFQIIADCSEQLEKPLVQALEEKQPIDIKDVFACFTTDVIGSCAFGIECNAFKSKDNPFTYYGKRVVEPTIAENVYALFHFCFPKAAKILKLKAIQPDVSDFFLKLVNDTVAHREQNNSPRNDFLQLLIDMKNNVDGGDTLTMGEVAAQAFIFFLGGFETSSSTGTFCLYELCINQEIQEKLREEIRDVLNKHDGKITYESMHEMKYMEQVINETLRMYPPLPVLNRVCTKDYLIPETDILIKEGEKIGISSMALQHDPDYFPEPEKFDPDRFSEENKKNIKPFSFIPFGEGPRICIGLRFGMMQTKVGLTALLRNYRFSLNSRTKTPLEMSPESFLLSVEGGVWLDVEKIN